MLVGDLWFDAAPALAVARDDDLAFDVDPELGELFVVVRHAVVDVDEVGRDVAVGGVSVERRQLSLICRVFIDVDRRFFQFRRVVLRTDELDEALGRIRHQRLELFDGRVQAPRLELRRARTRRPSCSPGLPA